MREMGSKERFFKTLRLGKGAGWPAKGNNEEEQKIMERVLEVLYIKNFIHFEMSCKYLLVVYHLSFDYP